MTYYNIKFVELYQHVKGRYSHTKDTKGVHDQFEY